MDEQRDSELPPPLPEDALEIKPIPFGGLLYLFGFLFLIVPISNMSSMLQTFSLGKVLGSPVSGSLNLFLLCVTICLSLMLAYSFFSKSKAFINQITYYSLANIFASFLTLTHLFFMVPLVFIAFRVIPNALLIIYFQKSSRAKRTFVEKQVVPDRHFYLLISIMLVLSYLKTVVR